MSTTTLDQVILVDANDQEIGTLDKFDAHRNPAQLHRAVSVWLLNSQNELLFQQRSAQKIVGAGWWGNTICGNVRPGESYDDCAARRLREELGITEASFEPVYTFHYQAYGNQDYSEHEMDRVFVGRYDGLVTPNPAEAQDFAWLSYEKLKANTVLTDLKLKPEETVGLSVDELKAKTPTHDFTLDSRTFELTPWTGLIWKDPRLHQALESLVV